MSANQSSGLSDPANQPTGAKQEAEDLLVNLPSRAKRDAHEMFVNQKDFLSPSLRSSD